MRLAVTDSDVATVAALQREYVAALAFALDFQDFDGELARLPGDFGPPGGALFLAFVEAEPVGTAALRTLSTEVGELKRMYVRPSARGHGLGRLLADHAIAAARRAGLGRVVLDTDAASMQTAGDLYVAMGFTDIAPYRYNPLPEARYLGRDVGPAPPPVGVVLTGGHSSRMGTDKPALTLGGRRLVDHVVAGCSAAGLDVRVAGTPQAGLESITLADPPGLAGPAAGLAAAVRALPGADIALVAADQPYLRPATVAGLLATLGPVVVPVDGSRQTLCAVYRDACVPELERLLAERGDPSLQTLLDRVGATEVGEAEWRRWGEDGRSWLSIDTPQLLAAAVAAWPEPPLATIAG